MYWSNDPIGRFKKRPVYSYSELDYLADARMRSFLVKRRGHCQYPSSTDDLTVFLEQYVSDLDLYHDFSSDSIEGETIWEAGKSRAFLYLDV